MQGPSFQQWNISKYKLMMIQKCLVLCFHNTVECLICICRFFLNWKVFWQKIHRKYNMTLLKKSMLSSNEILPGLALLQLVFKCYRCLGVCLKASQVLKFLLISRHLNIIVISTSRERNLSDSPWLWRSTLNCFLVFVLQSILNTTASSSSVSTTVMRSCSSSSMSASWRRWESFHS